MIIELIFSGICGGIASYIIIKFLNYIQKKRQENPERILSKLQKQKKEFYIEGKKVDLEEQIRKELQEKLLLKDIEKQKEIIKQELEQEIKEKKEHIKEQSVLKQGTNKSTLNKMLGKK